MKQTSFVIEVVLTECEPLIVIRDTRGIIVKVCSNADQVSSFLEEIISKMENAPTSN